MKILAVLFVVLAALVGSWGWKSVAVSLPLLSPATASAMNDDDGSGGREWRCFWAPISETTVCYKT